MTTFVILCIDKADGRAEDRRLLVSESSRIIPCDEVVLVPVSMARRYLEGRKGVTDFSITFQAFAHPDALAVMASMERALEHTFRTTGERPMMLDRLIRAMDKYPKPPPKPIVIPDDIGDPIF